MASLSEINALSQAIPGLNEQAAKQQQAALRIQAGTAAGGAPSSMAAVDVARKLAAPTVAQQAKVGLQNQQATQQQLSGLATQAGQADLFQQQQAATRYNMAQQADLNERTRQAESRLAAQGMFNQRAITQQELEQARELQRYGIEQDNNLLQLSLKAKKDLSDIAIGAERTIFDSRRQFAKDERGRKFTESRQLADAAIATAQNEADLQSRLQSIDQANKLKLLVVQAANEKLLRGLSSEETIREAGLDTNATKELHRLATENNKQIARDKAKATATNNMIQAAVGLGPVLLPMAGSAAASAIGAEGLTTLASYL